MPTKKSANIIIDNNIEDSVKNNSGLKEIIHLINKNNKKEFEKFKDKNENPKEKQNKTNLNFCQVYALGFITPIILFGIYYVTKKIQLKTSKNKNSIKKQSI